MNKTAAIIAAFGVHLAAVAAETDGSYEIVALDRAEFPRYDGGWNPGSGAEVEFSGWKLFRQGEELSQGDSETFSTPDGKTAPCDGLLGAKRFFKIKSTGGKPSYAQRTLNQKIGESDILSASLFFSGEGEGGMVVGQRQEGDGILGAVAVLKEEGRYLVVDGDGEAKIDMDASECPIGVSFVFLDNGTYTLQTNEMKKGGKVVDIGPRKVRGVAKDGACTIGFFAKDGAEVGFDDLQVERFVK